MRGDILMELEPELNVKIAGVLAILTKTLFPRCKDLIFLRCQSDTFCTKSQCGPSRTQPKGNRVPIMRQRREIFLTSRTEYVAQKGGRFS
jgi:hypothetical protein